MTQDGGNAAGGGPFRRGGRLNRDGSLPLISVMAAVIGLFMVYDAAPDSDIGRARDGVLGMLGITQPAHEEAAASEAEAPPGALLSEPVLAVSQVMTWASSRVSGALTFPHNPEQVASFFTLRGHGEYTAWLGEAGIAVADEDVALVSYPSSAPRLIRAGVEEGIYSWVIAFEVIMQPAHIGSVKGGRHRIVLKITRTERARGGLLIDRWRSG